MPLPDRMAIVGIRHLSHPSVVVGMSGHAGLRLLDSPATGGSSPLEAEATRRGVTPSALIRQLIEAALNTPQEDATVTVRLSDVHRAIDTVVKPAA